MPYYAVRKGRKPGIYETWNEAKEQVLGFSGAEYKKFNTKEEAEKFMANKVNTQDFSVDSSRTPVAFVDGSFKFGIPSAGVYIEVPDGTVVKRSFVVDDYTDSGQIAGELEAAIFAIKWAIENKYKEIIIVYDYAGIEKFATGEWIATKPVTQEYKRKFDSLNQQIKVRFKKVKAHSGVRGNEMADSLSRFK